MASADRRRGRSPGRPCRRPGRAARCSCPPAARGWPGARPPPARTARSARSVTPAGLLAARRSRRGRPPRRRSPRQAVETARTSRDPVAVDVVGSLVAQPGQQGHGAAERVGAVPAGRRAPLREPVQLLLVVLQRRAVGPLRRVQAASPDTSSTAASSGTGGPRPGRRSATQAPAAQQRLGARARGHARRRTPPSGRRCRRPTAARGGTRSPFARLSPPCSGTSRPCPRRAPRSTGRSSSRRRTHR